MRKALRWTAVCGAALAAATALTSRAGARRWENRTRVLTDQLLGRDPSREGIPPVVVDFAAFDAMSSLPAPVRRYFRASLQDGQRAHHVAHLDSAGTFRLLEPEERRGPEEGWLSFTATQTATARPPGLLWIARVRMASLLTIDVRDGYVRGTGSTEAMAFGLVPLVNQGGTRQMNAGALLRWLAEAAWIPPALLPREGLTWSAIDDTQARATVQDGLTEVSAVFTFAPGGDIVGVAAERDMATDSGFIRAGWAGRFWDHGVRDGMRIPLQGEVAWHLNGDWHPYWRGRIVRASYEG